MINETGDTQPIIPLPAEDGPTPEKEPRIIVEQACVNAARELYSTYTQDEIAAHAIGFDHLASTPVSELSTIMQNDWDILSWMAQTHAFALDIPEEAVGTFEKFQAMAGEKGLPVDVAAASELPQPDTASINPAQLDVVDGKWKLKVDRDFLNRSSLSTGLVTSEMAHEFVMWRLVQGNKPPSL